MNRDTRAYMKAWQKEAGCEVERGATEAPPRAVPEDPFEVSAGPERSAFPASSCDLARAFQFRQRGGAPVLRAARQRLQVRLRPGARPQSRLRLPPGRLLRGLVSDGAFTIAHGTERRAHGDSATWARRSVEITNVLPLGGA